MRWVNTGDHLAGVGREKNLAAFGNQMLEFNPKGALQRAMKMGDRLVKKDYRRLAMNLVNAAAFFQLFRNSLIAPSA